MTGKKFTISLKDGRTIPAVSISVGDSALSEDETKGAFEKLLESVEDIEFTVELVRVPFEFLPPLNNPWMS